MVIKNIFAGFVLATLFVLNVGAVSADPNLFAPVLNAVYKLQSPDYSCTATAIKTDGQVTYFLTARHCTMPVTLKNNKKTLLDTGTETNETVFQPGQTPIPVTLILRGENADHDWAILEGQYAAGAVLPLASVAHSIGEKIIVAGYPYGVGPVVTEGVVSSGGLNTADLPSWYFAIYVYGAPGNSGSAVVDENTMTIIGILDAALGDGQGDPVLVLADPISDMTPEALSKVGQ